MVVYLDSCIAICAVEGPVPLQEVVLAAMERSKATFVASELVWMECRVGTIRRQALPVAAEFDAFFSKIPFVPLTHEVFEIAAKLRTSHSIRTPDAIHLGAAKAAGCAEFLTNDAGLRNAAAPLVCISPL